MARLHAGIIALCLFALTCTAYADIGTVRLQENRLLFGSPAIATGTPNQFVKVICHADEDLKSTRPAKTITSDPIHPLVRVSAGETLTILDIIRCGDAKNGAQVQVRTAQNITGFTNLPNYHTRIQTTDPEAAYKILFLTAPPCILTNYEDPECRTSGYADDLATYARTYPTSRHAANAAGYAGAQYKYAADTFQWLYDSQTSTMRTYTTRYPREALPAKVKEYRTLATEMQAKEAESLRIAAARQALAAPETSATPQQTYEEWQRRTYGQSSPQPQSPPHQNASPQPPARPAAPSTPVQQIAQPTPSAPAPTLSDILTTIFYLLLLLLTLAYIIMYPIRYKRISSPIPTGEIGNSIIEGIVFLILATSISYFLADFLKPFVLIAYGLLLSLRIDARLKPAREQRAEAELKRNQETFAALTPLLNHLHAVYGRYSDMPELTPASWYEPRKHYIEYMADGLYTYYQDHLPYPLDQHSITAETHPLIKLRWLSFPRLELQPADLQDQRHPYNVIIRAITDPNDRNHVIFRDLIPSNTNLLRYLKEERWLEPLARISRELELLVMQEIIKRQYVIIGTPQNRKEYPLPIFYRDQRFRHTYVIGKTGSGKSTLLRNLIAQDIHYGNGLIVLSPENDLFERLLAFIPPERKDDLIYFDPTDTKPPIIGFNPLTLESGEDLTQKAGETMTALKRALGDLGVTMEPLIQNAVYALLQRPQSTFADLARLIDPFDTKVRATVKNDPNIDETTRTFWQRYERSTYYQKSYEAVINRLNPFFRPPISTILATPSLSFKTELNQDRRIIFLNLSRLRGMEAATIGQLILAEIQQSLLVRDELPEEQRIPYYLYIDEFQTYAGDSEASLISILNGARKYKLGITLAHQTTSDIPSKLLSTIVGNVGTVISLQLAAEDAPFFARELQIRRENKDSYSPEALQNLSTGYGYVRTPSYSHGVCIAVPSTPVVQLPHPLPTDELKSASKKNYGLVPKPEPEEEETHDVDDIFVLPRDPAPVPPAEEPETATVAIPLEAAPAIEASPVTEPVAVEAPAKRKRSATPRQARKPVVRNTIKKKSLIPEEEIEIE